MAQTITSRENERVKYAGRIALSAAFRAGEGVFFAEGVRLCEDLAQSLSARTVFATPQQLAALPKVLAAAAEVYEINDSVCQKLAQTQSPQGLFCLFEMPCHTLETADFTGGTLVCEAVQDPANVGALLRSAAGLGMAAVLLGPGCADPFAPKALRAAMGAAGRIPVVTGCPLRQAAAALKAAGATVYAAAAEGALPLYEASARLPFALLVGNEGAGLSEEALALAQKSVCIPMKAGVESLNVAAAAAVLMYRLLEDAVPG
ncbi:RNA methyltransferase [Ruminococcaceae bacterium OttesenSCG-928-O06]|nr:RNA methyltransferase [Ruminococcaceae bacterium OttesenSCG-928-O06]